MNPMARQYVVSTVCELVLLLIDGCPGMQDTDALDKPPPSNDEKGEPAKQVDDVGVIEMVLEMTTNKQMDHARSLITNVVGQVCALVDGSLPKGDLRAESSGISNVSMISFPLPDREGSVSINGHIGIKFPPESESLSIAAGYTDGKDVPTIVCQTSLPMHELSHQGLGAALMYAYDRVVSQHWADAFEDTTLAHNTIDDLPQQPEVLQGWAGTIRRKAEGQIVIEASA